MIEDKEKALPLLEVQNLKMYFPLQMNLLGKARAHLRAVDDVSFKLDAGKTIGVVGESGCGKTTLGRTILKLYDATGGRVIYYGRSIDDFLPKYYLRTIKHLPFNQRLIKYYQAKVEELTKTIEELTNQQNDLNGKFTDYNLDVNSLLNQAIKCIQKLEFQSKLNDEKVKPEKKEVYQQKIDAIVAELPEESVLLNESLESLNSLKDACETYIQNEKALKRATSKKELYENKIKNKYNESSYSTGGCILSDNPQELKLSLLKLIRLQTQISNLTKKTERMKEKDFDSLSEEKKQKFQIKLNVLEENIKVLNIELSETKSHISELKSKIPDTPFYQELESNRDKGLNLVALTKTEMRALRTEIQLIFQDPYSSLPPRMTVGAIIAEAVKVHHIVPKKEVYEYVLKVMKQCGLQPQYYDRYPHEFSGGQRQRICIARALAVKPKLIICDEPVSALDVSIQAQIINLLKELQNTMGLTYVFISHDLSVVKYITDDVMVMYLGNVMEIGDTNSIFDTPLHPYTEALFSAVPVPNPDSKMNRIILNGDIPSPANPPKGCKFHTRCNKCMGICKFLEPKFLDQGNGHFVSCHLLDKEVMAKYKEEKESIGDLDEQK
ncbi:MAG: ATP-binding cassette domain-containing protein [Anaeroplasmataceae bacterium]|nr:ATP-binding cassette domain-containing protein [Anaeroplasmataceae bacterium]